MNMKKNKPLLISAYLQVPGPQQAQTLQDSAACCTRCNNCSQSCPAYLKNPQEFFSPRGRVYLVRLLAEQKIKPAACRRQLEEMIHSCALCARCTAVCAGSIPVAHYMLLLGKILSLRQVPRTLQWSLYVYNQFPVAFDWLARAGLALRRAGLWRLGRFLLPGWLRHADDLLPTRARPLQALLAQEHFLSADVPRVLYLPSLYACYADAQTGWKTIQLLANKKVRVLLNYSSGLAEYLYGQDMWVHHAAKRLLVTWEKLSVRQNLPLVTDSIEVYSFLKNYPLLFAKWPGWQKRARKMACQVKYITDFAFPKPTAFSGRITALDTSSVLYPAKDIAERARKILLTTCRKNLLECHYSRLPLAAGGTGFIQTLPTQQRLRQYVQDIARKQIADVYCLSGWAALELNAVCKRLYPHATAKHLVQVAEYGRNQQGKHPAVRRRKANAAR